SFSERQNVFEQPEDAVERIVRQLQRPVPIDPAVDGRVMDEIARLPVPGGRSAARAAWGWVTRPRHIALSPLGGLAIAAGVAAVATALAAAFVATAAAAQDPRLGRLDPGTRPLVAVAIDSARAAGLPTEPLVQRALEGATKGAPGPLIVSAVQRLAADLGRAR